MTSERLSFVEDRLRPKAPFSEWTHINSAEPDAVERLREHGVEISGPAMHGSHDFFLRGKSDSSHRLDAYFEMSEECLLILEEPQHWQVSLYVLGARNTFAAVGSPNMPGAIVVRAECHGEGNRILFADGFTSNGCRIIAQGGQTVDIGEDCMFADGITIRTTDNHAIFDGRSGEVLNPTRDVTLGTHVWLGHDVSIGKGVTIGAGTVVGARSLVSKSLPSQVLAYGTPAVVTREGIGWTRTLYPTQADKRAALALVAR